MIRKGIDISGEVKETNIIFGIKEVPRRRLQFSKKHHCNKSGYIVYVKSTLPKDEIGDHYFTYVRIRTFNKAKKLFRDVMYSAIDPNTTEDNKYLEIRKRLLTLDHKLWNVGNKDEFPGFCDIFKSEL